MLSGHSVIAGHEEEEEKKNMDDIENVDGEKYRDQKMDGGRACDEDEAQNNHNVLIQ